MEIPKAPETFVNWLHVYTEVYKTGTPENNTIFTFELSCKTYTFQQIKDYALSEVLDLLPDLDTVNIGIHMFHQNFYNGGDKFLDWLLKFRKYRTEF